MCFRARIDGNIFNEQFDGLCAEILPVELKVDTRNGTRSDGHRDGEEIKGFRTNLKERRIRKDK